jgi:hypothetical protein
MCEYAKTLMDRISLAPMRRLNDPSHNQVLACARILEPCFWSPVHPFCYEVSLELRQGDRVADMRMITAGVRHLQVVGLELLLNGQPMVIRGVKHFAGSSIMELEAWHDADCGAFLIGSGTGLYERTDRWGPMLLHLLAPVEADAKDQVTRLRNHPSVVMWVMAPGTADEYFDDLARGIRQLDRSRPIGRFVDLNEAAPDLSSADVLLFPVGHSAIGTPEPIKPYIVVGSAPVDTSCTPASYGDRISELGDLVGSPPGLVGVML